MRRRLSLALAVTLALPVLALPAPALAESAVTDGASIRLVVTIEGAERDALAEESRAALRSALEDAGYASDDSIRADATVRVRVSFFNEADLDYQINVDIAAGGQLVQLEGVACPQCDDEALLAKIAEQHEGIISELERALASVEREGPGDETPAVTPEPSTPKEPAPIGALGGVGIGVAALGLGAMIAGGVEFGRGRVYDETSTGLATERTGVDHRPVGGALLGVGGVAIIAGVSMLVVDVVQSRAKRERPQARAVHPVLGPGFAGLGVSGQF